MERKGFEQSEAESKQPSNDLRATKDRLEDWDLWRTETHFHELASRLKHALSWAMPRMRRWAGTNQSAPVRAEVPGGDQGKSPERVFHPRSFLLGIDGPPSGNPELQIGCDGLLRRTNKA